MKTQLSNFGKQSVFYMNVIFLVLNIFFYVYGIPEKYFFYLIIIFTFIVSFLVFKKSKILSKYIILTNMFIFVYFLFSFVSKYLEDLFGKTSYFPILLYNIGIAYLFVLLSGHSKDFLRNIKKINLKFSGIIVLIGVVFGLLFYAIKEPIPNLFFHVDFVTYVFKVFIFTLVLAISEQMMFAGFLFNIYNKLTVKNESIMQVAIIFVLFHLLKFNLVVQMFFQNFEGNIIIYLCLYMILLFAFMSLALYLYAFKSKKYEGNFIYPVLLHFITDFILFILIKVVGGY